MKYLIAACLLFHQLFSATAYGLETDLPQLGVAPFISLKKTYYLAALNAEDKNLTEQQLLDVGGKKQLTLKVTEANYSQRRFSIHWSQALIINSDTDALLRFDDSLVQFQNIIDAPFQEGDTIAIRSSKDGKSEIFLNEESAFEVEKPGFLELLLSTWIGSKPPSTEFKQQILGTAADIHGIQFAALSYTPSRNKLITAKEEAIKALENDSKPELIAEAKPKPAPVQVVKAEPKPAPAAPKKPEPVAAPAPVIPKEVAKAPAPTPQAPLENNIAEDETNEIDSDLYEQHQSTLRALYATSSTRRIRSMVKYPKRAQQLSQEGVIKVLVNVDRSGLIQSMQLMEPSRYKLLNKAALKAIEASGKLAAMPPALDDKSMDIVIPFSFKLG